MKKWKLNHKEVFVASGAGYSKSKSHPDKTTRSPEVTLVHLPTGIRVSRSVAWGNYSRKDSKKIRDELQNELFKELENLVAAHLRIAGR